MNIPDCINQLIQFREQVYKSFSQRGDSLMDLLDALCSTRDASSIAELSLNSLFRRGYSALYAGVQSLGELIEEETRPDGKNPDSPTRRFPKSWVKAISPPEVTTEERWVQFSSLAYAQLWVARSLACLLPNPWQQYLPAFKQGQNSPSMVQRDFERIIQHIGTPAAPCQPRGKSGGRREGFTLDPRPRRPIVKRSRPRPKKRKKTA